jgi:arginase
VFISRPRYPKSPCKRGVLAWEELRQIAVSALSAPTCAGVSVVIYDPDKDQDGAGAENVGRFVEELVGTTPEVA